MNQHRLVWGPAVLLLLGVALTTGSVRQQQTVPLREPLHTAVPASLAGFRGEDVVISDEEQRVAGMSSYVMRVYSLAGQPDAAPFSVYVGYYDRQMQGKTIHSPKNCLPGSGWEPLESREERLSTPLGAVTVNRYVLQNKDQRALVLYWYQGRGRMAANEYLVKWNLLRDQALLGRSDEALVRIIVPLNGQEEQAQALALRIAEHLIPSLDQALPPV